MAAVVTVKSDFPQAVCRILAMIVFKVLVKSTFRIGVAGGAFEA